MWNTANRTLQTMREQSVTSIGKREDSNPTLYGILWVNRTHLEKLQKKGRLLWLNLAVYRRITATSHRINTEITQIAPRYLGFFSSHNVYYVKITIFLDKSSKACYTGIADSHRGFLEYQRGRSSGSPMRDTGRRLGVSCEVQSPYGLWYRGGLFFVVLCNL